eukprot:GDKI01016116.1.p1 GENE.GDKI01016116.1~~GDKI01016116.1.p1  ORF type:complete len:155 (+),score=25.33 GDKI01016116.1:329-793(+)
MAMNRRVRWPSVTNNSRTTPFDPSLALSTSVTSVSFVADRGGAWKAEWVEDGRLRYRCFYVAGFGHDGAHALAVAHRQKMERKGKVLLTLNHYMRSASHFVGGDVAVWGLVSSNYNLLVECACNVCLSITILCVCLSNKQNISGFRTCVTCTVC